MVVVVVVALTVVFSISHHPVGHLAIYRFGGGGSGGGGCGGDGSGRGDHGISWHEPLLTDMDGQTDTDGQTLL